MSRDDRERERERERERVMLPALAPDVVASVTLRKEKGKPTKAHIHNVVTSECAIHRIACVFVRILEACLRLQYARLRP